MKRDGRFGGVILEIESEQTICSRLWAQKIIRLIEQDPVMSSVVRVSELRKSAGLENEVTQDTVVIRSVS